MNKDIVNPEVLRAARLSRGCTQDDIATAAGVSQGLISKVEKGVASLAPTQVKLIADYLHYPTRTFYEPGRVVGDESACLYHRKRRTLPAQLLNELDARMHMRNLTIRRMLDGLEIQGDRMFYTLDPDEYGESPIAVAQALRAAWRVPDGPIQNLTTLIESAGGVVLMEDFGTKKLFGMSCWTKLGHPLFFLNSAMATEDLRWTMAHELGHLTMHAVAPSVDPENQADEFAGEFLAPEARLRPDLRNLTFDRLGQLKGYWRISMKAIIKRAQVLGAIDVVTATRFYKQYSARRYNTREPYPLSAEPPTIIDQAIRVHLDEHGYTASELAEAVLLEQEEFERDLMRLPPRHGNVISLFPDPRSATAS